MNVFKMNRLAGTLLLSVSSLTTHAATSVPTFNETGIPAAGFPHFENAVTATLSKVSSGYKLTAKQATGTFLFQADPTHAYNVTGPSQYKLTANFDNSGHFVAQGSSMEIDGTISVSKSDPLAKSLTGGAAWTASSTATTQTVSGELFNTSLSAFGYGTGFSDSTNAWFGISAGHNGPLAIGFRTDYASANGWAKQFEKGDESVYLYNFSNASVAWNDILYMLSGGTAGTVGSVNATSITTVPIPAAFWLLGSALTALGLFGRRNNA